MRGPGPPWYHGPMTTITYSSSRRKVLELAFDRFLTPSQRTMALQLMRAEDPTGPAPRPEDMLYWIRLNMPTTSNRIEKFLHPRD